MLSSSSAADINKEPQSEITPTASGRLTRWAEIVVSRIHQASAELAMALNWRCWSKVRAECSMIIKKQNEDNRVRFIGLSLLKKAAKLGEIKGQRFQRADSAEIAPSEPDENLPEPDGRFMSFHGSPNEGP